MGSYDPILVSLSIAVAIFASYASLLISQHVSIVTSVMARRIWLAGGGLSLGVGIWTMHFVGMLAFNLPCSSRYDVTITLLSVLPGLLASTLAISMISQKEISTCRCIKGGMLIGAGIGAMHYSGMAAMRLDGIIRYDIKLFLLSVLVAVVLASFALWVKFHLRTLHTQLQKWENIASAIVMGLSVSGMHYTAMTSAYFIRTEGSSTTSATGLPPLFLASIVLTATCLIIVIKIIAIYNARPGLLSFRSSYLYVSLLILGWASISWLASDYYYKRRIHDEYLQQLQTATQQARDITGNIKGNTELLIGTAQVFSHHDDTVRALRLYATNPEHSLQPGKTWYQDKVLGDLNLSLWSVVNHVDADIVFVINADGVCIAASNFGDYLSPIGKNFADRKYFPMIKAGNTGRQYDSGDSTRMPGIFVAHPVMENGQFLGAVVAMRDISKFARWMNQANAFVVDDNGVILLAPDKYLETRQLPYSTFAQHLAPQKRQTLGKWSRFSPIGTTPWTAQSRSYLVPFGVDKEPTVLVSKRLKEDALTIFVPRTMENLSRFGTEKKWLLFLLTAAGGLLIVAASTFVINFMKSRKVATDLRIAATAFEVQEGIIITDTDNNILRVNNAFTATTGYSAEEVIGKNPKLLQSGLHQEEFYATMWHCILRTGGWEGEIWNQRKNGERFPEWLSIATVKDKEGHITNYVACFVDITDRKRAELATQKAREIAEAASRTKSLFLSNMSHELRTPLNAMIGFSDLLLMDEETPLSKEHRADVQMIFDAANHQLAMLEDIFDISKIDTGNLEIFLTAVSLDEVFEQCIAMTQSMASKKGVVVTRSKTPAGLSVHADKKRIQQCVLNLLTNAIKYNHQDGQVMLSAEFLPDAGTVRIDVKDTGIGIARENLADLFKPFNRLGFDNSAIEGTGIGLALTKKLVEAMNGNIGADSEPGVGSTFWIILQSDQG